MTRSYLDELLAAELGRQEEADVEVGVFSVNQSGDAGGTGINRFALQNSTAGSFSNADLNNAAAAIAAMYNARRTDFPGSIAWAINPTMTLIEATTGALVAEQNIPTVPPITAGSTAQYVGGTGIRLYWHTVTVKKRRLIRGATYVTPLTYASFSTAGVLSPTVITNWITAATAYLTAVNGSGLLPVVLCRPSAKGLSDGTTGVISSVSASSKPCSLRSRRS